MTSSSKKLRVVDSDDEDSHSYPSTLFESAKEIKWNSPVKKQKTSSGPRSRASKPVPRRPQRVQGAQGSRDLEDHGRVKGQTEGSVPFCLDLAGHDPTASLMPTISDLNLNQYVDAVNAHTAGFYHLERNLFVVQGFDTGRCITLDTWYHLEYLSIGGTIHSACTCPIGIDDLCIHRIFFSEYQVEHLVEKEAVNKDPTSAIIFSRQLVSEAQGFKTLFSVKSLSSAALRGRPIVSHQGFSSAGGRWNCSKDSGLSCSHIKMAWDVLDAHYQAEGNGGLGEGVDEIPPQVRQIENLGKTKSAAVSHQPVLPPPFASLHTDPLLYPRPIPYQHSTTRQLTLDAQSSCPCPSGRSFWEPQRPVLYRTCQIYTLFQRCPTCPPSRQKYIGPDLRELGLFNYNNSTLVSHQLLDEYTSEYTFMGWQCCRRYQLVGQTFMGEDLFRTVWFAYVSLQALEDDMYCSRCGTHPETIICDGVTLAFGRKHLRSTLHPPTVVSPSSITRSNIRYYPKQQLIVDCTLRKEIRMVLNGPSLDGEHVARSGTVYRELASICDELANLFLDHFGMLAYTNRRAPSLGVEYNYYSISLPPIHQDCVCQSQYSTSSSRSPWIEKRVDEVLNALIVEDPLPNAQEGHDSQQHQSSWQQSGSLYSMPKIRERPYYPHLRNDQQRDKSSKRGDRCGKYFALYGQQCLTGRIMVVWCTHSICYGFHTIAASEGRDDVFSAIDFACALGPYCMLREPEFFADTFFAIDHFHSTGHSKCSAAAFLSEYSNVDPCLVPINSSAAECGNGGLHRIRKSVSYMSQDRAIIFTKVFLSIWNRVRLKQM
ncbi:hypothetical protein BKA70DRAFT_1379820 [Coprinopsis sp. MPI-PUGE-AT-0042]|nr:hypothetical protein BKA70DRAFT_1379820 [Coprinopsis sp. MPI-PUGE-AT-0042]